MSLSLYLSLSISLSLYIYIYIYIHTRSGLRGAARCPLGIFVPCDPIGTNSAGALYLFLYIDR